MKLKKMNRRLLQGIALGVCISPWTVTYAAQQEMLWGSTDSYAPLLKNFSLIQSTSVPKGLRLPTSLNAQKNNTNTFQFVNGNVDYAARSHVRYDQYYQGLPVWGSQIIYHITSQKNSVTGSLINGIANDVPNLNGKLSLDQIKQIAIGKNATSTPVYAEKIIYFNQNVSTKALLAYHVSYGSHTADGPAMPSFIIDANSGKILQEWDALPTIENGSGYGGVQFRKEYQYGQVRHDLDTLGLLEITPTNIPGECAISNSGFRVYNLKNIQQSQVTLPVSSAVESRLLPFTHYCSSPNLNDNGYAPTNGGISPVNDATYFVQQTMNMLREYGVNAPVGPQLPVRVYTHIANYDSAFACDPACMRGFGPQQLVFGNGETMFSPLTEGDVVAHEFGHLVTGNFSKLIYAEQSGGMNESFSDMTGLAINNYMRNKGYDWYWNGLEWNTGSSITKSGLPLRYFDEPTKDGRSISNAANFTWNMNTHYSSGVYNKAFYLLSNTPGWTVQKAYQVMLDANMYYWSYTSDYYTGACGVRDAAIFRGYSRTDVENALRQVVVCPRRPIA
jgi:pseudolysin